MDMKEFSNRVSEILKSKSIMKKDFCNAIGISVQSFSLWEKNTVPSAETIVKMSEYLGVTCDYLLTGKTDGLKHGDEPTFTKEQVESAFKYACDMVLGK